MVKLAPRVVDAVSALRPIGLPAGETCASVRAAVTPGLPSEPLQPVKERFAFVSQVMKFARLLLSVNRCLKFGAVAAVTLMMPAPPLAELVAFMNCAPGDSATGGRLIGGAAALLRVIGP